MGGEDGECERKEEGKRGGRVRGRGRRGKGGGGEEEEPGRGEGQEMAGEGQW